MEKIKNWLWEDKKTTESTNDDAVRLSQTLSGEKFIISAQKQTKGRGRRGRKWISLEGNLFFSQGLCVDIKNLGQLICVSSLSLYEVMKELLPARSTVCLKWPNDVLIDNCKVSGTLLEKGDKDYLIIGIGVNICQKPETQDLLYPVTSLKAKGIDIDRLTFLRSYVDKFDNTYAEWQHSGFDNIRQRWLDAVKGLGKAIRIHTAAAEIEGIFEGIGENGELWLRVGKESQSIYAGDVFYVEKEK